ncbi:hypothetical protein HP499_23950 [Paenarthrobacter sp. CM16]|uniref:hypothetical protein n=1 Tax=Paenarthrobacter sp. CM16 TaxID=2738447 RepID=UPI001555EA9E|nr:hypothetical protein [Paenarthrobacter sp. CM16]NQD90842.1 hypothetical protein [Paenarthrobacter sp. CM16]
MSHGDEFEELRWQKVPRGTRRSASNGTAGYDRDLLRENGTGNLLGPTESRPASIDDIIGSRTPAVPTIGQQIAGEFVTACIDGIRPHVLRGVNIAVENKLWIPKLTKWIAEKSRQHSAAAGDQSPSGGTTMENAPAASATEIEADAVEMGRRTVTAEQHQAILLEARRADEYAAQMRNLLSRVSVRDVASAMTIQATEGSTSSINESESGRAGELPNRIEDEFMHVKNYGSPVTP